MRDLLEHLARALVDHPEEVLVELREQNDGTVVLALRVGKDDYGKIIGRGGRTAHALRHVIRASGDAHDRRVVLDIVE